MGRYNIIKNTSRLMAVLLVLMLLVSAVPVVYADGESGTCGDSLSWSLSAGTLTITGSGAMKDFPEDTMAPWYPYREEIIRVELPSGLTSVGDLAFYDCKNLTTVVIPDSVTMIGRYAFALCTGMELLNLGGGVRTIGEAAFSDCVSLASLHLPNSLQSVGLQAFYRCESITTVMVPAGVTSLGMSAFGYCKSLVSADVRASISVIPEFLFYGCEKLVSVTLPDSAEEISEFAFRGCDGLNTVYYDGEYKTPDEIQQEIDSSVPGFESTGSVSDGKPTGSITSGVATENSDGTITQENTTVIPGDNSSVSSEVTVTRPADFSGDGDYSAEVTVTVNGDDGWKEATDALDSVLNQYDEIVSGNDGTAEEPNITVYVKDTDEIDQDFIDSVAGKDVTVTIITQDGSVWKVKGTELDTESDDKDYDFRYEVVPASAELCQELNVERCFVLRFNAPAVLNAEVMIRLDSAASMQNATLLQKGDELTRVQSTVVDQQGYAHFYLGSVDDRTEYYIAINLPDVADAIVPEELSSAYGTPEFVEPIRYEITGRKSSWGMTFSQVTWIMVAVLVSCVVVVGVVMFALNRRRLRMGYVPDLDDEDYE